MHYRASATPATAPTQHSGRTRITKRRRRKVVVHRRHSSFFPDLALSIVTTMVLTAISVIGMLKVFEYTTSKSDSSATDAALQRDRRQGELEEVLDRTYDEPEPPLPWNPFYRIPGSHPSVGDRSDAYAQLRLYMDRVIPPGNKERSLAHVQRANSHVSAYELAPMNVHHSDTVPYNIYDCPDQPPMGYPFAWKLVDDVLANWNVDETEIPKKIHQGLCVFDYETEYNKAMTYRNAEVPFVVINDPSVAATSERWAQPGYLESMLRNEPHRTEYSENNHFMYYVPVGHKPHSNVRHRRENAAIPADWHEPTIMTRMRYSEWLHHANVTDDQLGPDQPHWYYRLIGCGDSDGICDQYSSEYLFDELEFFQPKPNLYIVEPEEQKGIHCRFGMKGVIAENHFDGSRNAVAVLGGSRRYILSHPDQCEKLALFPKGHPSARHSAVEWANPDLDEYPDFEEAMGNEVILQAGQVLYLPTEWFHFIVSLELCFQCNTRSGITQDYHDHIRQCGF